MRNVLIVTLIGITVGFLSIATGYLEAGASMCSAIITGYFGYSRQQRNSANIHPTILAIYVNVIVLTFLLNTAANTDIVLQVMAIGINVFTGYFGFTQQNIKED